MIKFTEHTIKIKSIRFAIFVTIILVGLTMLAQMQTLHFRLVVITIAMAEPKFMHI